MTLDVFVAYQVHWNFPKDTLKEMNEKGFSYNFSPVLFSVDTTLLDGITGHGRFVIS